MSTHQYANHIQSVTNATSCDADVSIPVKKKKNDRI